MQPRWQNTIARSTVLSGFGFFTGAEVCIRFLPAEPDTGIVFRRTDLPGAPSIPATLDYVLPRQRRTAIGSGPAVVEMTEHVMAALAGLQIDNCTVELDGPEPPGCDGSSLDFANALCRANIVQQAAHRRVITIRHEVTIRDEAGNQQIRLLPQTRSAGMTVSYTLNYGSDSPIPAQHFSIDLSPELFFDDLAYARTFVLEQEVAYLRSQGYGQRVTAKEILIFGPGGVVGNKLRSLDECARHKTLDCVGDFALLGCDINGIIECRRSGHRLNAEAAQRLRLAFGASATMPLSRVA